MNNGWRGVKLHPSSYWLQLWPCKFALKKFFWKKSLYNMSENDYGEIMNTFNKGANGFTETIRLLQQIVAKSFHVFVKLDGTPTHSQTQLL